MNGGQLALSPFIGSEKLCRSISSLEKLNNVGQYKNSIHLVFTLALNLLNNLKGAFFNVGEAVTEKASLAAICYTALSYEPGLVRLLFDAILN